MSDVLREVAIAFGVEFDTSELKKGEKETEDIFGKVKEGLKLLAEAFAIKEVYEFIEGQVQAGAQLKVTAERLGTTTDELQAMRLAAGEAGVSAEAMDTSLRFLNRNIGLAATGSGEQAATFAKLGIALKDSAGVARPVGDIMGDLADKVAETGSTAEKTRISMELLGRGGSQLIPLLNKGGEAFKEATKDVADLGGGLSSEFTEAAHKAEEQTVRLTFAATGLKANIANALLPGFVKLVEGMTGFVKTAIDVEKKSHIIETSLEFLKGAGIAAGIYKIVTALQAVTLAEVLAALPVVLFAAALVVALLAYNDLAVALTGGKSVFGDVFGDTGIETLKDDLDDANDALDGVIESFSTLKLFLGGVYDILALIGNTLKYIVEQASGAAETILKVAAAAITPGGSVQRELNRGKAQLDSSDATTGQDALANLHDFAESARLGSRPSGTKIGTRKRARHGAQTAADNATAAANLAAPDYDAGDYRPHVPAYMLAPSVPGGSGAAGGAAGGTVINQANPVTVTVHATAGDVPGIVRSTGKAIAGAQTSSLSNALTTNSKP